MDRVLHITDCHILPAEGEEIYGADTYKALEAVLEAAKRLDPAPQFAVLTGDLSEDGSDASYFRLRQLLLASTFPAYVIAGNHDSHDGIARCLLGGSIQKVGDLEVNDWRIVFVDSTVHGKAHGYLERTEIERLQRLLSEDRSRPMLTCLHHSPIRPCPSADCHLRNDGELLDVLDEHENSRVVLAGHSHVELSRKARFTTLLTSPATSSQCKHAQLGEPVNHEDFWDSHSFDASRHGFRVVDLFPGGRFESQVYWVHSTRWVSAYMNV